MFEIYISTTAKKHYLVFNLRARYEVIGKEAKKYFRCGYTNIVIEKGWVLDEALYFENPHKKGTRTVWVASHWRKQGVKK